MMGACANGQASQIGSAEVVEEIAEVRARDGYALRYRTWRGARVRATVILVSGVMSHAEWFGPLAAHLAGKGFLVVGADRRGSGLNRQSLGDAPSADAVIGDLGRVIGSAAMSERPIFIAGWCWGAVPAACVAAELSREISGLILLAPGLHPSREIQESMESRRIEAETEPEDRPCLVNPIREEMFTRGPWLENFILKDALRLRHFTPRFLEVMRKMGLLASLSLRRLDRPILVILAARDATVDNERTLRSFEKLRAPVRLVEIDSSHGMQFEAPDLLVAEMARWMDRRTDGSG